MKRVALGIVALIFTSLLGVAIWKTTLDPTIYPVSFCDLIRDARRYDQKLVRVQVMYDSGVDTSSLFDPTCAGVDAWIRPTCSTSEACHEIYRMIEKARRDAGHPWEGKVKLEVTGRYYASALDPAPTQGFRKVHVLEMIEGKDAKFIGEEK